MGQTTFSGPVVSQNGFIENSFTTAQRDAIANPTAGLLIYNTTVNAYQVYNGTTWQPAFSAPVPPPTAPTITSTSPGGGTTAGGTSVTITGTNFTGATAVTFGGGNATSFTVDSSTQITAVSPSFGTPGAVDIAVTTSNGTATATNAFTYSAAPSGPPYTEGVDYSAGGVRRTGLGSGTNIIIDSAYWTNMTGFNDLLARGNGTSFTIVQGGLSNPVTAYTDWTSTNPGEYTITGAGSQYDPGSNQSSITYS